MNYFAPKPLRFFDFFTSREGEASFHVGTPTEDTAPMRRVLDAANPHAARLMVLYLQARYKPHGRRQRHKRAMADYLTWLDGEQIGLMQATGYDLRRYFNSLTSSQSAEAITWQAATVQGFYHCLRARL